jgi:hypothetical protein
MRGNGSFAVAVLFTMVACSGKSRPFADSASGTGGIGESANTGQGEGAAMQTPSGSDAVGEEQPGRVQPGQEGPPAVGGVQPVDGTMNGQNRAPCSRDAGPCIQANDAGVNACAPTGPRDCTSALDNDCDGQPDDTVDDVCLCQPGIVEPCDEHPGLDGRGQCRPGSRRCFAGVGNLTSSWGECEGSVAPGMQDSCLVVGDDTNCDGTDNGGCPCIEGEMRPCGPETENGICQLGSQTCVNGTFGQCLGAVFAAPRDCSSSQDNDCDGRPDNTTDNVCTCSIGSTEICGEHIGQDGRGRCQAGVRTCEAELSGASSRFGACVGSVPPLAADLCTVRGDDSNCDGIANAGCQCIAGDLSTCGEQYGSLGVCSSRAVVCGSDGRLPPASSCAPTSPELCDNNLDDDCDGQVNELDACAQCAPGSSVCADSHTANVCSTTGTLSSESCEVLCARGRCVDPSRDSTLIGCDIPSGLVCDSGTEQCCEADQVGPPGVCLGAGASCATRFLQCDGPSDCSGRVCCFSENIAVTSLTCRDPQDCVEVPPASPGGFRTTLRAVCDPTSPQCPAGSQCLQSSRVFLDVVFYYCTPAGEVP